MNLEFNVGDEAWAIIDVTLMDDRECPTCGQHVIRSAVARQVANGKILGIDVRMREGELTFLRYTMDFDGVISDSILQVWKTQKEAETVLTSDLLDMDAVESPSKKDVKPSFSG